MSYGNLRPPNAALILLSGLPGSGKTTFARALSPTLEFAHVESDAIRRSLGPQPSYSQLESGIVFARVEAEARKALDAGRIALVDATNLTTRDRRRFLKLADASGARLVLVRLVAPEGTVRERLSRPRDGYSQAGLEVFERMRGRAQPAAIPSVVVDTRFPLDSAIALVARLVAGETDD